MTVRVQNNCSHAVGLPPRGSFPDGWKLIPGLNHVPREYIAELQSFRVPHIAEHGGRTMQPLFESLAQVSKTSGGKSQVVVLDDVSGADHV